MNDDYYRVEKAIKFLEENYMSQPSLKEIASHLNMSPYHFQRLFKRWAGISPKQFLQVLTIKHARKLLEEYHSVLDVTYEAGLSSPGRLHDLFVTVDAVTPGEYKAKGRGIRIDYGVHETPFGKCLIAVTSRGICGLYFLDSNRGEEAGAILEKNWANARLVPNVEKTRPYIDQIFSKNPCTRDKKIGVYLKGTNFQIKVWEALLKIPPGLVCSYEDIARAIGHPAAVRAVGSAVAKNPVSFIIPCHRVIRKMGAFGNYGGGPARKKAILGWEAALKYREEIQKQGSD